MMATKTAPLRKPSPDRYLDLLRGFPPRPIRDEDGHRRAIGVIDSLIDRGELTPEERDYLDVLGTLVKAYEDSIYEHPEFSGGERLRYLMDENEISQASLARETGIPVQSLSDILNGKRNVSPKVRAKLAEYFSVPPSLFV